MVNGQLCKQNQTPEQIPGHLQVHKPEHSARIATDPFCNIFIKSNEFFKNKRTCKLNLSKCHNEILVVPLHTKHNPVVVNVSVD
jgi:hypothetical protein